MKPFSTFTKGIIAMSALASASALAGTFVYVSNAEDGEIGVYSMQADGALKPLARTQAAKVVMPMAVSPNRRLRAREGLERPIGLHAVRADLAVLGVRDVDEGRGESRGACQCRHGDDPLGKG